MHDHFLTFARALMNVLALQSVSILIAIWCEFMDEVSPSISWLRLKYFTNWLEKISYWVFIPFYF